MRSLIFFLCLVCSVLCFPENALKLGPISNNKKIIIVGAGSAGIAAGVKLLEDGFGDVVILEAESRIGGRIHTIPFGENVIDLGAQWCHGEEHNVVYDLVKDLDMLDTSMDIHENVTFHRSNGEKIPQEIINRMQSLAEEITLKRFDDRVSYNGSTHDFMQEEFSKAMLQNEFKNIDKIIAAELIEYFEKEECSAEGSDDLKDTPLRGDFEYSEGNQVWNWKNKGYQSFLNLLMKTKELGKEYGVLHDHIRLSKKVNSINWKRNDKKVLIKCKDNEELLADHVIITVSLGVLKEQHTTLFNPALPDKKQEAIREIGFGIVNKIFLEFDKQFWPDYWTGISFVWTDEDLKTIRNTENFWWEGLFGMFAIDFQPRVFELWLIGPSARYAETLNINKIKHDCLYLLQRFTKWNISEPVNIIRTGWHNNPNFRGTWSYHSLKMFKAGISATDLVLPLTVNVDNVEECGKDGNFDKEKHCEKPMVLFAGEASNVKHFSTVHGAVESGWREANRLSKLYGL